MEISLLIDVCFVVLHILLSGLITRLKLVLLYALVILMVPQ
jgi:hypothetical protein